MSDTPVRVAMFDNIWIGRPRLGNPGALITRLLNVRTIIDRHDRGAMGIAGILIEPVASPCEILLVGKFLADQDGVRKSIRDRSEIDLGTPPGEASTNVACFQSIGVGPVSGTAI